MTAQAIYTLYADRMMDGHGSHVVGSWQANDMPDNEWYNLTINNVSQAQSPCGHYFYRLEVAHSAPTPGADAFKLRSTAYLMGSGDAILGLEGRAGTIHDMRIVFPDFQSYANPGSRTTYDGDWRMKFYVPVNASVLEIWDGDFDRGTSDADGDTDDPNTSPGDLPPGVASTAVQPEGAAGRGMPPDNSRWPQIRRGDPVWYEIIDPDGLPVYTNQEPSGTEEWERYVISTDANVQADEYVQEIKAGFYTFHISGLDLANEVWLKTPTLVDQIPPPPCDATCPRTIGYWKNNVKKVLIDGKTNGVQETPESLQFALQLVAEYSLLYRYGIDVNNPQPIGDPVPLTAEEANMILQRSQKDYPGGRQAANSMLARALQQNLATWLNWGSGKICDNTVLTLDVPGGGFNGTVEAALAEAQKIILDHNDAQMERAKDIADQINNGLLGEDADVVECVDTTTTIPPDLQPPPYDELPEAPDPAPPAPPAPPACTEPIHNQYGVENPTNNPFYGIKFEYQSGDEVLGGAHDVFKYTLPADAVAAMTSVQLEAKAGQYVGQTMLEGCDFTSAEGCSTVAQAADGSFVFQFMGATDNGDGTLTLTFHVMNFTDKALSHATFGLPAGVVPSSPSGSYQSEVCP